MVITNKHIYFIGIDFEKTLKNLPLSSIESLVLSGAELVTSDNSTTCCMHGELVLKIKDSHDKRLRLGAMRDTVADLIMKLRSEL